MEGDTTVSHREGRDRRGGLTLLYFFASFLRFGSRRALKQSITICKNISLIQTRSHHLVSQNTWSPARSTGANDDVQKISP